MIIAERYHDFSAGHRVVGHEGACALLHGHNYRVHFKCAANDLDSVGRVIDFSVIKSTLCQWLEDNWDHRFLVWSSDPMLRAFAPSTTQPLYSDFADLHAAAAASFVKVPFNPTAENMGLYLLHRIGPALLHGKGVTLIEVRVDETRKCGATVRLDEIPV